MSKKRSREVVEEERSGRRRYTQEFKAEAVQMLLDGHTASSVCERLGLSGVTLLYKWKRKFLKQGGPAAEGLEARVRPLEAELKRVERERDILPLEMSISRRHLLGLLCFWEQFFGGSRGLTPAAPCWSRRTVRALFASLVCKCEISCPGNAAILADLLDVIDDAE